MIYNVHYYETSSLWKAVGMSGHDDSRCEGLSSSEMNLMKKQGWAGRWQDL